jgi:hypothetical protein
MLTKVLPLSLIEDVLNCGLEIFDVLVFHGDCCGRGASIGPIRRLPGRSRPGGAKTKPSILRKAEPLMVRGVENEGHTAGMEMGE